jgi:hypothetical protein
MHTNKYEESSEHLRIDTLRIVIITLALNTTAGEDITVSRQQKKIPSV